MQQDYKMYINGEWINSSSGKKIETLNPETNEVWATVPEAKSEIFGVNDRTEWSQSQSQNPNTNTESNT